MTFFDRLVALTKNKHVLFRFAVEKDVREAFTFLHACMVASEDLCEVAAKFCFRALGDDYLRKFFLDHLREESGHAEWLADDLELPLETSPDFLAAAIAGTQYYLIHHHHPAALLGYMVYLEANPMPLEVLENLESRFGLRLLRTMRHHALHDPEHANHLRDVCNALPESLQPLVIQSLAVTAAYWQTALCRQEIGAGSISFTKLEQRND